LQMWSGKTAPYMGKHYRLAETLCSPLPISKPHPPIMIGGAGEKRTLPLVAKYADACNLYAFEDAAVLRRKLDVLRRHCDAIGRRFEEIERTAIDRSSTGRHEHARSDRILPQSQWLRDPTSHRQHARRL